MSFRKKFYKTSLILVFLTLFSTSGSTQTASSREKLIDLLPKIPGWSFSQEPEFYGPESLFEYIDGASEAYLAYDFQGLIVAYYKREKDEQSAVTVEIYDMGEPLKAYGIYSSERPPESHFLQLGYEGYLEEGTLYFIADCYYVKVFSFLNGHNSSEVALLFGQEIARLIPDHKAWSDPAIFFPPAGLKPRTIKFILRNFLGFDYLHHAFLANYEREGVIFEAFLIQAKDPSEAEIMESKWKKELSLSAERIQQKDITFRVYHKYLQNVYISRHDSFLLGLLRLAETDDELALAFIKEMISCLKKKVN